MPADLSFLDSEVTENFSEPPETPLNEILRTCTRQTPCGKQSCLTCSFPADSNSVPCTMQNPWAKQTCFTCLSPTDSNNIQNLTTALNTTWHTSIATQPAPPADHWISDLTLSFQNAFLLNNLDDLKLLNNLYAQKLLSEHVALKFDRSNLTTTRKHTKQIIKSRSPVPNSPSSSPPPTPSPVSSLPGWKFQNARGRIMTFTTG